jgi:tetratricopeptide (TPR) repeat protein
MESIGKMLEATLTHYEKKEYVEAEKLVDELLADNPNFHRGWFLKGIILEETGRAQEAEKYMGKAGNVFTLMFRLALQLQDVDPQRALTYYDKLLQMDPHNNMAWFSRGLIYEKLGDRTQAQASFRNLTPAREIISRILVPLLFMLFLLGGGITMMMKGDKALATLVLASSVFCFFWLKRDIGKALQMLSKKNQYK